MYLAIMLLIVSEKLVDRIAERPNVDTEEVRNCKKRLRETEKTLKREDKRKRE